MELDLLQISIGFGTGLIVGVVLMLVLNKLKSGSASPAAVKAEFDEYKNEVEAHFETTSKKFEKMTEQYQDLYDHLAVGATTLCRADSVAAGLADQSAPQAKLEAELKSEKLDDVARSSTKVKSEEQKEAEEAIPEVKHAPAESEAAKVSAAETQTNRDAGANQKKSQESDKKAEKTEKPIAD